MANEQSDSRTYRGDCHVEGCETRFIGISRSDYVAHLREEHSEGTAEIWGRLVVDR